MVMANRVYQTVKRHIKHINKHAVRQVAHAHGPAHHNVHRTLKDKRIIRRAVKSMKSIAHRIVRSAKSPRHAKAVARKLVLRILSNPKNSRKTKRMALKIYRNVTKIIRNVHHTRKNIHRVRYIKSHKIAMAAHHSVKRAAKLLKKTVNVKAHLSKKNVRRMSKVIAHKILRA